MSFAFQYRKGEKMKNLLIVFMMSALFSTNSFARGHGFYSIMNPSMGGQPICDQTIKTGLVLGELEFILVRKSDERPDSCRLKNNSYKDVFSMKTKEYNIFKRGKGPHGIQYFKAKGKDGVEILLTTWGEIEGYEWSLEVLDDGSGNLGNTFYGHSVEKLDSVFGTTMFQSAIFLRMASLETIVGPRIGQSTTSNDLSIKESEKAGL